MAIELPPTPPVIGRVGRSGSGGVAVNVRKYELHAGPEEQEYRTSKAGYSEEILALYLKLVPFFCVDAPLILLIIIKFTL